ncbi:MAG: DUF4167 domain-containing protein [Candidatus Devosia phytovorans]|uniref:DUF4167 domain-containing protein n=1 Tax=Candidatus Devosia phytovorans TaxID=3121372 RepID=A0AAJ6B006_9HYPH|nr:DUF4167 domain-containing protein [Devosia sp.]WEK04672.1 MAG: DUF4167 domain-containing protein [Devosia sp.]
MRPNNQNNKNRQRGRNGGRKHVNPLSRNFESNGPDVKVRGNAAHIAEKYLQLARDAQSSGDSVMAENYLQHAEHYFRIVSSAQQAQNGQRPDGQDDDFDDDMPDMNSRFASPQPQQQPQYQPAEGEEQPAAEGGEQPSQQQGEQRPRQEGERPPRGDRRDRNRNRERFRPEGEVQQLPVPTAAAEQPVIADAPVEAAAPAAPVEAAVEGEDRAAKPRERRPRRRRPAAGEGDLANSDQPDVGGLPAFLTGGATNAAE